MPGWMGFIYFFTSVSWQTFPITHVDFLESTVSVSSRQMQLSLLVPLLVKRNIMKHTCIRKDDLFNTSASYRPNLTKHSSLAPAGSPLQLPINPWGCTGNQAGNAAEM